MHAEDSVASYVAVHVVLSCGAFELEPSYDESPRWLLLLLFSVGPRAPFASRVLQVQRELEFFLTVYHYHGVTVSSGDFAYGSAGPEN